MANIYQRIYDADIRDGSGIPAFVKGSDAAASNEIGYAIVNESQKSDLVTAEDLFDSVAIPSSKEHSYNLAEDLFDNYNLDSREWDEITDAQQVEVDNLVAYVQDRPPMVLAREYITDTSGVTLMDSEWDDLVKETWFRAFQAGDSPTRSGFEHVFLGERKGSEVGGLHWWYFYYKKSGAITYKGNMYENEEAEGMTVPEVATMEFVWHVDGGTIHKPIGGFFVGLSVEGLMAMGMVCSSQNKETQEVVFQGAKLELCMFKSDDGRSISTFFPIFKGLVANNRSAAFRLISAVTNPVGNDAGREKITLMNVFGEGAESLSGWRVVGPNGTFFEFGDISLDIGEAKTFTIPAHHGILQLSNKGGTISVKNPRGDTKQEVTYSREIAKIQGAVLLWDGNRQMLNV